MATNDESKQNPEEPKIVVEKTTADPGESEGKQKKINDQQKKSTTDKESLEGKKRILELKILQIREKKKTCLINTLLSLVGSFSIALIGIGVYVFFFFKYSWNNSWNWVRLIFGSIVTLSIVVLIITFCHLLKKILSPPDEE